MASTTNTKDITTFNTRNTPLCFNLLKQKAWNLFLNQHTLIRLWWKYGNAKCLSFLSLLTNSLPSMGRIQTPRHNLKMFNLIFLVLLLLSLQLLKRMVPSTWSSWTQRLEFSVRCLLLEIRSMWHGLTKFNSNAKTNGEVPVFSTLPRSRGKPFESTHACCLLRCISGRVWLIPSNFRVVCWRQLFSMWRLLQVCHLWAKLLTQRFRQKPPSLLVRPSFIIISKTTMIRIFLKYLTKSICHF